LLFLRLFKKRFRPVCHRFLVALRWAVPDSVVLNLNLVQIERVLAQKRPEGVLFLSPLINLIELRHLFNIMFLLILLIILLFLLRKLFIFLAFLRDNFQEGKLWGLNLRHLGGRRAQILRGFKRVLRVYLHGVPHLAESGLIFELRARNVELRHVAAGVEKALV
jgi:hypothetical protein